MKKICAIVVMTLGLSGFGMRMYAAQQSLTVIQQCAASPGILELMGRGAFVGIVVTYFGNYCNGYRLDLRQSLNLYGSFALWGALVAVGSNALGLLDY